MMVIVEYRPEWVGQFERIRAKLAGVGDGLRIEHVGGTSVPGLAAKPIIDIDIVYQKISDFERIKVALERSGYRHHGNQGIEGREVFKRDGVLKDEVLDGIAHHLYVCHAESEELHRHLLFRDYLRRHASARLFYQCLKYEIAAEAEGDRKVYAAIKELKATSFVSDVIESAKAELKLKF